MQYTKYSFNTLIKKCLFTSDWFFLFQFQIKIYYKTFINEKTIVSRHFETPAALQLRMPRGKQESTVTKIQAPPRSAGVTSPTRDRWTRVGGSGGANISGMLSQEKAFWRLASESQTA